MTGVSGVGQEKEGITTVSRWVEIGALETFLAVADHGSLSAAARELKQDQPNVSRSISRLERRFGVTLLHRSTAGSTLTPEGTQLAEWAREFLGHAQRFMELTTMLSRSQTEHLTLVASQTIADFLLPDWLAQLGASDVDVSIGLRVANTDAVIRELYAGRCDMGFIEGPVPSSSVNVKPVGEDRLAVVVTPDHPWANLPGPLDPAALVDGELVTREQGSGTRRVLDDALTAVTGSPAKPKLEVNSNAAVRIAVLAGAGVAALSPRVVGADIAAGDLVEVPLDGLEIRRHFHAVWVGPHNLSGAASELLRIAVLSSESRG